MHNTGIKSGSPELSTGSLSVSGPQPGWMTLDEARERAFTGEIVFEVDPEVFVYLDNGVVYYAERASDPSLARRLVEAGVIEQIQLERGTVRVGDVEHLGRLFDREPSVDRDAVMVVTETSTEDLTTELANHAVTTVRVTAYRHHPSGIHRWFVALLDAQAAARQMGSVSQIDPTIGSELPGLSMVPDAIGDELVIEWDELSDPTSPLDASGAFDVFMFDPYRDGDRTVTGTDVDVDDVMIEFDAETTEVAENAEVVETVEVVEIVEIFETVEIAETGQTSETDQMDEIDQIDETIDETEESDETIEILEVDSDIGWARDHFVADVVAFEDDQADFQVTWPTADDEPAPEVSPQDAPAFTRTDDGELRFEIPALELSDDDEAADEVPDEVAAAVRRAIAAIEMVSGEVPVIAPMTAVFDPFDDTTEQPVTEPIVPSSGVFAPPTMDMRAEVMYAQEAAAAAEIAQPLSPPVIVEPVVLVDDRASDDAADERTSALRRLIGSLRRKDH